MIDWDAAVLGPLESVFGEPVNYMPAAGGSFSISGVFDAAYRGLDLADGMAMSTETPVLGVRLSQFPMAPEQGDSLTLARSGVTYVVREVRPDSHGAARLMLNQASP